MISSTVEVSLWEKVLQLYKGWSARLLIYLTVLVVSTFVALLLDLLFGIPQAIVLLYLLPVIVTLTLGVATAFAAFRPSRLPSSKFSPPIVDSAKVMRPRTKRQKETLDFIILYTERRGHGPSYAQIARHLGVKSTSTVAKHIAALERRGWLKRLNEEGLFTLAVRVDDHSSHALCDVPLLGAIAAGRPLEVSFGTERISVPYFLLGRVSSETIYAMRVKGDSMIDEHICDGDIALIENRTDARDGEIVVAIVDGVDATLKRFYRLAAEIELRPANSQLQPLRLPANRVEVQGIFRGLLRPSSKGVASSKSHGVDTFAGHQNSNTTPADGKIGNTRSS